CGTGVLGGFTTYSAFVLQSGELAGDGRTAVAAAYAVGSVALGLVAAGVGLAAGDVATRRRRRDGTGDDA
ncbi:MAG: fluoride efflux transporter FluC, partial [Actinomycetaceae bacterium]